MSTGGPEETNSQNEVESERAELKTLAIININYIIYKPKQEV